MKTPHDPRHKIRQKLVQELFKIDYLDQPISKKTKLIISQKKVIDQKIKNAASEFPVEKINKVDLAILRLAIYELIIEKREPKKVIIDEAVELAKEFGGDTSPSFVNGALGNIVQGL